MCGRWLRMASRFFLSATILHRHLDRATILVQKEMMARRGLVEAHHLVAAGVHRRVMIALLLRRRSRDRTAGEVR